MISLKNIIRPSILNLKAYSSARSLTYELDNSTLEAQSKIKCEINSKIKNEIQNSINTKPTIYLDANESSTAPNLETNLDWERTLNRYPSPQPQPLIKRFSEIYKVDTKNILITRGSDEAIDTLTRAVCEPNQDAILIMPPTYGMYEVSADIQNIKTIQIPLVLQNQDTETEDNEFKLKSELKNISQHNWHIDLKAVQEKIKTENNLKLIYICSPNNPTGTVFSKEDIKKILNSLPAQMLLVVDQAYCEFSPESSVTELLKDYPQLVILRTLSKAWGLAGLRLGALLGHSDLISVLQKVRAPYPIPSPVIELALTAVSDDGFKDMKKRTTLTVDEREFLKLELLKLNNVVQIYPSVANFLLVEFKDVQNVMTSMLAEKIILRDRSSQIKNTIRITVGSKIENELLINCLKTLNT